MASFLRKFVKSKSRSKSPVKHYYPQAIPPTAAGYSGDDRMDERVWIDNADYHEAHGPYYSHGEPSHYLIEERQGSGYYSGTSPNKFQNQQSTLQPYYTPSPKPYGTRRKFFDFDDFSGDEGPRPIPADYYTMSGQKSPPHKPQTHISRKDLTAEKAPITNSSPNRRKSPKRSSKSPTRKLRLSPPPIRRSSPPSLYRPQYYFTQDYKSMLYDDVPDKQVDQAHPTYSPLLSGQSPNPATNTTRYYEAGPSSSNTLSPAWQNTRHNTPRTISALRPTSSEYINGGAPGTYAGAGWNPHASNRTRLTPSTPGSTADVFRVDQRIDSNGYLSGGTAITDGGNALAYYTAAGPPLSMMRPRSTSPRKAMKSDSLEDKKFRSRSPTKRSSTRSSIAKTFDYLHAQCKLEGCSAAIIVEDTQFLVCKHQLTHASDFFRTLFLNNRALPVEGVKQTSINEYTIVVSGLKHPPQSVQFQWFIESTIPCPILKSITDNSLETCMRLSKRFSAKGLEFRCAKFIQDNVEDKPPMMALCWLNWVFKHRFDRLTHDACFPVVARLSLQLIEKHRQMLPERVVADLIAMKLRTCYQQTAKVFFTIHKMDHFYVEMDKCPRCGRQREQGKIRIQGNPCQKLIGCERCLREFGCEIERKGGGEFEAYHQCEHGLWPFNDSSEDCGCQIPLYKLNFRGGGSAQIDALNNVESAPLPAAIGGEAPLTRGIGAGGSGTIGSMGTLVSRDLSREHRVAALPNAIQRQAAVCQPQHKSTTGASVATLAAPSTTLKSGSNSN